MQDIGTDAERADLASPATGGAPGIAMASTALAAMVEFSLKFCGAG